MLVVGKNVKKHRKWIKHFHRIGVRITYRGTVLGGVKTNVAWVLIPQRSIRRFVVRREAETGFRGRWSK
jgi:hypothetical protein